VAFDGGHLLGATLADLRTGYKQYLVEESEKQAAQNLANVEKFVGKKLDALGKPSAHVYLRYPPTEYGAFEQRIELDCDEKGKVKRYWCDISYDGYPPGKDEIMGLLRGKFGPGKEVKDWGEVKTQFKKKPKIDVAKSALDAWTFE